MYTLILLGLAYLIFEATNQIKTMKTFRSTRYYIFKYLANNKNNKTYEDYLFKSFFPMYIGGLLLLLLIACVAFYAIKPATYVYGGVALVAGLMRLYNRTIFSSLWIELKRTK